MPQDYESVRDKLIASGKSEKDAKSEAAAIWVKRHKRPFPKDAPSPSMQSLKAAQ